MSNELKYQSPEDKLVENTAKAMNEHSAATRLHLEKIKVLKAFLSQPSIKPVVVTEYLSDDEKNDSTPFIIRRK